MKRHSLLPLSAALALAFSPLILAQAVSNSGTVRGLLTDPSNAVIRGATIQIQNPVSGFAQTTVTDNNGSFQITNIPYNNYHLNASAEGFQTWSRDIDIRSPIPLDLRIGMTIGATRSSVNVEAGADLVETEPTTHTDVDRGLFDKLPLESNSSSLSSLVTLASPGVAADSNGMFHGLGDHAQNSFSIDGQPITDQQSKAFSNQLPVNSVQSMEVIQGAPPAEYGDKTSLVIVVDTRSGLGANKPRGDVSASYGTFGTSSGAFDLAYGRNSWGNFISLDALNTGRFLDPPEFAVMHAKGNQENLFDRVDYKPSNFDTISVNLQLTRSWFQTPNSFDMQLADAWSGLVVDNGGLGPDGQAVGPTDQRSKIRTWNIAPTWTRILSPHSVFTFGGFARQDQYNYYPSNNPYSDLIPDLQSTSVGQNRKLTNLGLRSDVNYSKGIHSLKGGVLYQHTILTENDRFGLVDPTFNPVCLNADGSPYTGPDITDPAACAGDRIANPGFVPILGCLDLTRTAPLPGSDRCAQPRSAYYPYRGHADIRETALYLQDTIRLKNLTFNLGIRGDIYKGITSRSQAEPRVGIAYNIKGTNTVLRASYARTLETPFNENLVLSSTGCSDPAVNALMATIQGYDCVSAPLRPGTRNEYHLGLEQAFGRYFVFDGEYIWKFTNLVYDFSVFANSPITFPIEWSKSKIPGFALRGSLPNFHGLSAFVVMSHVSARFFQPQLSGIGVTPQSSGVGGVFRIDHDEAFNQTTHLQYQPWKNGPWFGMNWRYDSGLVAGAVPCAGGNCANGPNGSDTVVDVGPLTPDQQFQSGLYCGAVHATPFMPISPTGLCPAPQYGSTLLKVPAPGTQNDDHNPPRVAQRNLFDVAIGDDNLFRTEKYKWSARLEIINLTNEYALYNFLSTFSGTHYVTPRTFTGTVALHF